MHSVMTRLGFGALGVLALVGCSGGASSGAAGTAAGGAATSNAATTPSVDASTGSLSTASTPASSSAADAGAETVDDGGGCTTQGCSCSQPGTSIACWTGPASQRGVGACHDGTQQCTGGESATWGACTGEELDCGDAGSADAGAAPVACSAATAECVPGASRWCDDGANYWGTQQCQSDGTWDTCVDTTNNVGPTGCPAGSMFYDENCCAASDQCCAHAVDGTNYDSVGNCDAIDPCNECKALCAPGATRWCSYETDVTQPPSSGGWGQQQCAPSGTWGACASVNVAPVGCGAAGYDGDCCAQTGQCCQIFGSCVADPGSANCPATACDATWADAGVPTAASLD